MVVSLFGAVSLVSAVLWLIFAREKEVISTNQSVPSIKAIWDILRSRTTLLVAFGDGGPLALITVVMAWLPTYYFEAHGIPLAKGGALLGMMSFAGMASVVLVSVLAVRVQKRRPFLILPGIIAGFAGVGTVFLADSFLIYLVMVALGFACWSYLPILISIPIDLNPGQPARVAVTMASLVAIGGGIGFLSPVVVGTLADLFESFVPGLVLFSILGWSLAFCGTLLPETGIILAKSGDS